jgi:hypothetical protein
MPEADVSMQEVLKAYRGRYVVFRVTERDANGQPARGSVIETHFDKHKLRDMVRDKGNVCIFYAGPAPKEGFLAVL